MLSLLPPLVIILESILCCIGECTAMDTAFIPEVRNEQQKTNLTDFYFCEESNLDVYRIVGYDDMFYIILKHKIIIFNVPKIETMEKMEKMKKMENYSLIIQHPTVILNEEEVINERIIGYNSIRLSTVIVYEIHETIDSILLTELAFDNVPCTKTKSYKTKKSINMKLDFTFLVDYNYNKGNLRIKYFGRHMSISFVQKEHSYLINRTLNYEVVRAALVKSNDAFTLLELDNYSQVHFHRFANESDVWRSPPGLSLASLLSCRAKITDFNQLKGIFFSAVAGSFFIFIDRLYLEVDEDIVKERFEIKDKYYASAKDLKFTDRSVFDTIEYPQSGVKWTNAVGDQIYFLLIDRIFIAQYRELEIELDELTQTNRTTEWIKNCFAQILRIANYVYCFKADYYYLLGSLDSNRTASNASHHRIIDMFDKVDVRYDNESSLEFIFNYDDNQFVMMTKNSLFVIDRTVLRIRSDTYAIQLANKIHRIDNCLFKKCKNVPKRIKPYNEIWLEKLVVWLLVISIIILIVALIFCYIQTATVDQRKRMYRPVEYLRNKLSRITVKKCSKSETTDHSRTSTKKSSKSETVEHHRPNANLSNVGHSQQNGSLLSVTKPVNANPVNAKRKSTHRPLNLPKLIKLIKVFDAKFANTLISRIASKTRTNSSKTGSRSKRAQNDPQHLKVKSNNANLAKQTKQAKGNSINDREAMTKSLDSRTKASKEQKKKRSK